MCLSLTNDHHCQKCFIGHCDISKLFQHTHSAELFIEYFSTNNFSICLFLFQRPTLSLLLLLSLLISISALHKLNSWSKTYQWKYVLSVDTIRALMRKSITYLFCMLLKYLQKLLLFSFKFRDNFCWKLFIAFLFPSLQVFLVFTFLLLKF